MVECAGSAVKKGELPLTRSAAAEFCAGDEVLLSGVLYTARDAAHRRFIEVLDAGAELPFPVEGATIYYTGPAPAPPGSIIGSAGPTTSYRMDGTTPRLLALGLCGMIGKGNRSPAVVDAIKRYGAVYFCAIGGAGALLAECIVGCEAIAFPDLGTEAVRRLTVKEFPVIVAIDSRGNNLYERTGFYSASPAV
ncbi:MAG: Fe-S-containing hydro-lyase [Spirochaetaceae bacterium]|jgi:fumarate hydratase subunit beta|nr:Fe-S-containing hydro-lyase [Spirochaetaceae bacterium]